MDFKFNEDQQALGKLAGKIFAEHVTEKSLKAADAAATLAEGDSAAATGAGAWFNRKAWDELARAGLVGIAIPEEHGGAGMGMIEVCLLLEQQGRAVAPLPLWQSLLAAALPIARFGSPALKARYLPSLATGEAIFTAALSELGPSDPARPQTRARRDGAGYVVDGVKVGVSALEHAARIVVPAALDDGVVLLLVDPAAPGVALERQGATTLEPQSRLTLSSVRVAAEEIIGAPAEGARIVAWTVERVAAGLCAIELGVAQRQLEMISEYVLRRQQFGKPIALFQAVAQRAADAYIDTEAIRLSLWQAAWRLASDLPATKEVATAKFWAAEGGARVAAAAQHLHGGMGFDRSYPLHRYFLLAKQLELTLGGANQWLSKLGDALATD